MNDADTFDPVLLLSRLVRRHAFNFATPHACVLLVNPGHDDFTIEYGMGVMEPYVGRIIQKDDGTAGYVLSTNQPQYIPNYLEWARQYKRLIPETRNRFAGVAGTPVYRDGAIWAILSFIWETVDEARTEEINRVLAEISTTATDLIVRMETNAREHPATPMIPSSFPGLAAAL